MHTGMLWFDNSTATLGAKINKAFEYYYKKYGRKPDLVLVHPAMLESNKNKEIEVSLQRESAVEVCKITIRPYRPVLNGHIWIGIEDKN